MTSNRAMPLNGGCGSFLSKYLNSLLNNTPRCDMGVAMMVASRFGAMFQ
jgi:hypothetical protein